MYRDGWKMSDRGPSLLFVFRFGSGQRRIERDQWSRPRKAGGEGGETREEKAKFNEIDADGRE